MHSVQYLMVMFMVCLTYIPIDQLTPLFFTTQSCYPEPTEILVGNITSKQTYYIENQHPLTELVT